MSAVRDERDFSAHERLVVIVGTLLELLWAARSWLRASGMHAVVLVSSVLLLAALLAGSAGRRVEKCSHQR